MQQLFAKKTVSDLLAEEPASGEPGLKKQLGAWHLMLLGIGAIIGAGLFVRTADAAAAHAGPAVVISFTIAAIGCAFAGLCYAEFASMIPIAGSAYTYAYVTFGQFIAWIIGWDLVLEYAIGGATISIAWSEYLNKLLEQFFGASWAIPYEWCHAPFQQSDPDLNGVVHHGIMNVPAVVVLLLITLILIRGVKESSVVNAVLVALKVGILLIFIAIGWPYMKEVNHTPFIPAPTTFTDNTGTHEFGGWGGIMAGASVVFFAFIGFDAVSTAAQETKNPKRNLPLGIMGSLLICTVLYIVFGYVLTGIAHYTDFRSWGKEASITNTIEVYMPAYHGLAKFISLSILLGLFSAVLVMQMGQSRVFYSMSRDGLVPKLFAEIHPKYGTPWKSNMLFFFFTAAFAAFVPKNTLGDMTSIGALFAFVLICIGIIVMRKKAPEVPRGFRTPWVPVVPILGVIFCGAMMVSLDSQNWVRLVVWLALGMAVYFGYGRKRAKLRE